MEKLLMMTTMAACVFGACGAASEKRVAEIAATLPARPTAEGACAADRAAWGRLAATKEGAAAVKAAEERLGQPVPDAPDAKYLEFTQNGNRRNYEADLSRRLSNFKTLLKAECLEAKGRFLPKLVAYVDAICAMKSWTLPAHDGSLSCFKGTPHVDLVSSAISLDLAFCSAWLGDALPAATRAKILSEVDRRTFQPHLRHARGQEKIPGHWWFHGGNNWNSVCNANVVRAALMLVEDRTLRAEFVALAEESVPYALAGYAADGYCSEGMGYWNYGYGHHLEMGLALRAATQGAVDLFADAKTKRVMEYAYGFQIQHGISPHFADGGGNPSPLNLALGRQVWPDLVDSSALKVPLLAGDPAQFALRAFGQEPAPTEPTRDILPIRSWFPDAQVLVSRVYHPARTLSFGVAMKGGHNNELHNHNDVGSYTVMLDACEMAGDPGGEVYTRRTFSGRRYESKVLNSYGHPVPVIGGKLQPAGRKAAAKVLTSAFSPDKDVLVLDCTAAYASVVPTLVSLVRTFEFDRTADRFTVTDKVAFKAPTTFEVPVITYRTWKKDADGLHFVFDKSAGVRKMEMSVAASAPLAFSVEDIENPGRATARRLAFRFTEPVTSATLAMTYSTR